ncbi:hypothetical protein E2P81_ATG08553 [Venturia nashicola]|uniref:Uncharacterized protein n=1 Tax=Venturia nashicola TaxID=86259 RepID=A0A4Z1NGM8_9PEZI|nr:hypothetical protein E6O75_ATG08749 [Venturia nashicola]TLD20889.1 hypothetical protein E2P81_ATG08553 [Venturia nashicola]
MPPVNEMPMRRLTLTLATLVLLLTILSTCAVQYLPDEPLHLRRNITLYAAFVFVVSGLGLLGGIQRNATLINLFASHLLLDATLYFIPRVLLLNISFQLPSALCTTSPPIPHKDVHDDAAYRVRNDTFTGRAWSTVSKAQWIVGESCSTWTWGIELLFLILMMVVMGSQVWLALRVRRYALWLDRQEKQQARLAKLLEKETC